MRISCAILGSALKKGVMGWQGSKSLRAGGQDQGLWVGAESGHFARRVPSWKGVWGMGICRRRTLPVTGKDAWSRG